MEKTDADKLQVVMQAMDTLDTGWWWDGEVRIYHDTLDCFCNTEEGLMYRFMMGKEADVVNVDSTQATGGVFNEKMTNLVREMLT